MAATHAQELQQVYNSVATGYNSVHSDDVDIARADYFLNLLPPGAHVLDFGAGNGRDSQYFAHKGFAPTLLDNSPKLLAFARQSVPAGQFIQADMVDVQLEPESFDGIWASASLLHLTKPEARAVLQKLTLSLKKNGIFAVKVKEGEGEKTVADTKYSMLPTDRFFSFYTEDEMAVMMKNAGLKILKQETFASPATNQGWVFVVGQKLP
jgi:ubiquinone/menaquinone biosynthesis C-methylase UbiE